MTSIDPLVAVACWLLIMGVWPLANPGHDGNSFASTLDIVIHVVAGIYLFLWWVNR